MSAQLRCQTFGRACLQVYMSLCLISTHFAGLTVVKELVSLLMRIKRNCLAEVEPNTAAFSVVKPRARLLVCWKASMHHLNHAGWSGVRVALNRKVAIMKMPP